MAQAQSAMSRRNTEPEDEDPYNGFKRHLKKEKHLVDNSVTKGETHLSAMMRPHSRDQFSRLD